MTPANVRPPVCALIALSENRQPAVSDITRRLRALWPGDVPSMDELEDETGLGFAFGGQTIAIVRMPGPIPLDPDETHGRSLQPPLDEAVLQTQQAYLVIAAKGDGDLLPGAIAATQVAAAVADCCPHAIAVYWPGARHWLVPRKFVKDAVKHVLVRPPTGLWVDVRVWDVDANTRAGFTRGMKALGHKEFEVVRSVESADDLRDRLDGLCGYVLMNGSVIRDGHTVGRDEAERIKVLFCRSAHGFHETVLRLDYDEDFVPRRPWWKLI